MQQFHSHFSIADLVSSLLINEVVAVEATVGTLGKHVFNTDSPEKSPLKSSLLKEKKKPWAANLQVQTCAMMPAKNIFCLIIRIFLFSSILLLWCSCKSMAWKQCMTFRQAVYMSMMNDKYSSQSKICHGLFKQ